MMKETLRADGTVLAAIMQGGNVVAASEPLSTSEFNADRFTALTMRFEPSASVGGDHEIAIFYQGSGSILASIL